jgi:hypothetical protein
MMWLYGVGALALVACGFGAGVKVTNDHWKAEMLEAAEDHQYALAKAYERNNAIVRELEESRANVRTVYKTITKRVERIVDRPVYVRECLDDDGLHAVNDALRGSASPRQPDPALPAPEPAGG